MYRTRVLSSYLCKLSVSSFNSASHKLNSSVQVFLKTRAEERMGWETSQLALARCVIRGVLSAREQENFKMAGQNKTS